MLYVIENGKIVESSPVFVDPPLAASFSKDRKTKQRYIYIKTKGTFDTKKRQLIPTKYCQYDNITVEIR